MCPTVLRPWSRSPLLIQLVEQCDQVVCHVPHSVASLESIAALTVAEVTQIDCDDPLLERTDFPLCQQCPLPHAPGLAPAVDVEQRQISICWTRLCERYCAASLCELNSLTSDVTDSIWPAHYIPPGTRTALLVERSPRVAVIINSDVALVAQAFFCEPRPFFVRVENWVGHLMKRSLPGTRTA